MAVNVAGSVGIKVLCTSAAKHAIEEIKPYFERATTHTLHVEFGYPNALVKKVDDGEAFDVLVLSTDVGYLIERGSLAANSRTVLGRYGTGIAIPTGASKPEFGSVECLKRTLINAKSLATSGEGSSGRFFLTLLDRLGIADQIRPKIKSGPFGPAPLVARHEVDFGVGGLPLFVGVDGVEWVGLIPEELQGWLLFTAGLSTKSADPHAGWTLLRYFETPSARAVFAAKGLEPVLA